MAPPARNVRPSSPVVDRKGLTPGRKVAAATLVVAAASVLLWSVGTLHPVPPVAAGPLDVLLVTIDTLRADAVGAYGAARAATPRMDRLAAGGARYDDAHAHNVVTLPSHANILSGRHPHEHGLRDNAGFRFPAGQETLATLLDARGYRTGAFVSAFPLDSRFGLARGFDLYDDDFADATSRPAFAVQERRAEETVARARRWLDASGGAPTFAWVHLYEPHFPYAPPEPFASAFRGDPYHGEVAAADAALGPLLDPILARGAEGRTLVVLTSDHGESLGEHGEATHGIFAYEATLRVPLVLYQPRLVTPRVVRAPARHVDLLPTILGALGLPVPEGLPGRDLLSAAPTPATTYFEALSGSLNRGWAPVRGVIHDRHKLVDLPIVELYDLAADPAESRDLAAQAPGQVEGLRGLLRTFREADGRPARAIETAEARERLRSLGYLSGTAAEKDRYTEADDPKRLIGLDTLLRDVEALYAAGDLASALSRCRELVRRRPGMAVSLLHLAHLERESGDLEAAIRALRQAVAASPENTTAVTLLGGYLTQAGRAAEAAALLEPYASGGDPEVDLLLARGLALARLGRFDQAGATLARARAADPSNGMVLVNAGTVHLMAGAREKARAAFEEALALNPGLVRAHSSLGVMAAEDGHAEEAMARWRAAVALDPRECAKLVGLGAARGRRGAPSEARAYAALAATCPG